jgi:D-alanyl-D-alanine carboxypeptidase
MAGGASQIAQLTASTVAGTGEPSAAEKQAIGIYRDLQQGHIDRSLLAPNLNDYFSEQAIGDFRDSLGPLGEPLTFKQADEELRGGMTFRSFRIVYPGRRLTLTTYTYPDGKLEQYLVSPAG